MKNNWMTIDNNVENYHLLDDHMIPNNDLYYSFSNKKYNQLDDLFDNNFFGFGQLEEDYEDIRRKIIRYILPYCQGSKKQAFQIVLQYIYGILNNLSYYYYMRTND